MIAGINGLNYFPLASWSSRFQELPAPDFPERKIVSLSRLGWQGTSDRADKVIE
jgi:hypothetical protein